MEDNKDLGGWNPEKPVTLHVINICLEVKKDIEKKIGRKCDVFIPVKFRPLTMKNGYPKYCNYDVKVFVGDVGKDECVHAKILQDLPNKGGKITLEETKFPKTFEDPLIPF